MRNLKLLHERANALTLSFNETTPQSQLFLELLHEFQNLRQHSDPQLQKIGRLAEIFDQRWTQRQWLNLLVPLERYLDRRLTDVDILGALPDKSESKATKLPLIVIADHWRSAFNVGALFRLADGFGVQKIILTGYSPTPEHSAVSKTAMGSEIHTPWEHWESTRLAIQSLQEQNIPTWALETNAQAQDLSTTTLPSPMAIVLGNERFGLDPGLLECCQGSLRIPLRGIKNSMNVANCFGIFAYEWCRQHASK